MAYNAYYDILFMNDYGLLNKIEEKNGNRELIILA